jgi:hypothetical protein
VFVEDAVAYLERCPGDVMVFFGGVWDGSEIVF